MLFVKDLSRMTFFYADVLGMQPNEDTRQDNWVEFSDSQFSLHAIPAPIAAGIQIESPPTPREQTVGPKLTFEARDVGATLTKIESMGLPLLHRPWGAIEAVDPEGNVFALCTAS
jgi:predicted enzyme related to lactoylglutathione lyase